MNDQPDLHRLGTALSPKKGAKERIRKRVMTRIASQELLEAKQQLNPSLAVKNRIWERVSRAIAPTATESVLDKVREFLTPPADVRLYIQQRMFHKLAPQPAPSVVYGRMKWVASVAVVALLIQMSPALFLTKTTLADSKVVLLPVQGQVATSIGGMWQDVRGEITLEPGMRIRTYDGQASIVYRDDAVIRLGENTTIALHDTSERLAPAPELVSTLTLIEGNIWLQGLVPANVRGVTVAVSNGHVTVNEGSVSIADTGEEVAVKVWDRKAVIAGNQESLSLVAGEHTDVRDNNKLLVKKITDEQFQEDWPKLNLAKDAVHRQYIAHLQQERRAALAGILPTSTLYPVKRVAERVEVFLARDEEARITKRLEQANTRLNEAAALLAEGSSEEEVADILDSYRGELFLLASGTGGDTVAQFLIKQSMVETMAEIAASLPGDQGYVLKKTVLEASSSLPEDIVDDGEVQTLLFVDALAVLTAAVEQKDVATLQQTWTDIQPYIALLEHEDSLLSDKLQNEAGSLLARFALLVDEQDELLLTESVGEQIATYLPVEPEPRVSYLSQADVDRIVAEMMTRIYAFKMPRSRENQLRVELLAIYGHDEEGRFLRGLQAALPENSFLSDHVRKEIVRLRWQRAGEIYVDQHTGTGTDVEV